MNYMLCRNRVRNFAQWKRAFDTHAEDHRKAGLKLVHLWQSADNPNHVFFLFEVDDVKRARTFVESPAGAETGRKAGVIEGDYHFFVGSQSYGNAAPGAPEREEIPSKSGE